MELWKWLRVAWDRAAALAVIAVGAVVVVIGWMGVSGEAYPAKQLPFMMSGGVGGIFLLGVGALFWLSSDLRDEWTKLDRIEEALVRLAGTELVEPEALPKSEPAPAPPAPPVVLATARES
jgi:multisubunit Na+/H+ antiporter MnhB subunit